MLYCLQESKEAQLTQLGDKLTTALLEAQLSRVALEQKEAEFEHLKGQLVEAKAKSAQRKAAYNDAKAVWKKDLADAQAAGARVSTLESTIQTYTADVAALQAECDTLRQALASAKTDGIAAYTLEIEQLKSQLASEQTRHRQDLAELNEAMAQLRAEVSNKDVCLCRQMSQLFVDVVRPCRWTHRISRWKKRRVLPPAGE